MINMSEFADKLLAWYKVNRRILPWREDPTPYHVWISEIMLQQTRVEAVREYYKRFLISLPDIASLAAAPEDVYLKLWEGLGYYSRIRNLHKAAQVVMEEYGGELPGDAEDLIKLPGIGRYTSSAIASIAFGRKIPAVDGNLLRIFARLCAYEESIKTPAAIKEASDYYLSLMPEEMPDVVSMRAERAENLCGDFNQALMDLGTAVCLPGTRPACDQCPVSDFCRLHREKPGQEMTLPVIPAHKERKIETLTVFLIRNGEKTAVRKRPSKGLLAGLYEFPNAKGTLEQDDAVRWLKKHGVQPLRIHKLCSAVHVFTHKEWHMTGYEVRIDPFDGDTDGFIMAYPEEIREKYCIPSAFSAYLQCLDP